MIPHRMSAEITLPVSLGEHAGQSPAAHTMGNGEICLPVSLGEALDKLTILEIKLQKIQDVARRQDVQKEYDVLLSSLQSYVTAFSYHYRILKEVNLAIWEIQDVFHGKHQSKYRASTKGY